MQVCNTNFPLSIASDILLRASHLSSNHSISIFLYNALTSKLWASLEHKLLSELLNPVQVFLALLQQQFRNQNDNMTNYMEDLLLGKEVTTPER